MKQPLKLVTGAPRSSPVTTEQKVVRSTIAKVAAAKDTPEKPYEVRADTPQGLLLRVQPSGLRTYYVQVNRTTRIRIGPAGTFTLEQAKERAKRILLDPSAFEKKTGTGMTLAEYIKDHYAEHAKAQLKNGATSVARVQSVWKALLKKRISEITKVEVRKMRDQRKNAGAKAATINRDVAALSGVFKHWAENTNGKHPLAEMSPLPVANDERIKYLTDEESARLRKALADRDAETASERATANAWRAERGYELMPEIVGYADHLSPMTLLTINTGLRQGEMFNLTWEQVDLRLKTITVLASHSKGNTTRTIPLNSEALTVLRTIKPKVAAGLVFKSPVTGGRFNNIKKAWAVLTKKAELPKLRWHDLRHDFASQLVMRGVSLYTVQKLLGHSNSKMTQRYAKLAPSTLADAVEVLTP